MTGDVEGTLQSMACGSTPDTALITCGRGFFLEWQNGTLDIAGYMYDDLGNSVWYLTVGEIGGTASARSFQGNWWSYGNGQTLTGAWRPNARLNSNVAPMKRHRF